MLTRFMPIPDFPFTKDASVRFLPWIIGGLCFLCTMMLFSAVSMQSQLSASRSHMAQRLTVHIPANLDVPQALLIDHVQSTLKQDKRVAKTMQVADADLRKLVAPWLGASIAESGALPLPVLIEVELKSSAENIPALMQQVQEIHRNIRVQSYAQWLEDYLGTLRLMQVTACFLAMLLLGVMVLVIGFAARMSLMLHQPAINLLHSFGATGDYIARQFQWHTAQLALRGAAPGLILAGGLFLLLGFALHGPEGERLLPDMRFSPWHIFCGAVLLVGTVMLAQRAARRAVLTGLRRSSFRHVPVAGI